jgi:hypothetical protein
MSNPLRILQTLDRHLTGPTDMTIFGRAALALGFPSGMAEFHSTRDVDAILSLEWLSSPDENADFWLGQQSANAELSKDGLYLTHLFRETEVIIEPDWQLRRRRISLPLTWLTVYRPAVVDLILTKMARGDTQDMEDIGFLLRQEPVSPQELQAAFARARVPDVAEIRELFVAAQPKVLNLASDITR